MDDQKEIINEEEKIESVQEPVVENVVEPVESIPTEVTSIEEPVIESAPVTPEEQVTVEATAIPEEPVVEEAPVENTEPVQSEPTSVQSGKKKFDFKTAILIIFFILLFAMVMFMPQVTKFVEGLKKDAGFDPIKQRAREIEEYQNENNKKEEQEPAEEEKLEVLICTSEIQNSDSYDMQIEETFKYNDKKEIQTSVKKIIYKFAVKNSAYDALESDCAENALKYVENEGYETACTFNDKEVAISETFNLKLFKKIEDKNEGVVIEANAKYNAKADDVKKELEAKGYHCS